ncbi:plasmid mobilization protein [Holdemanella biformis]|uniref:plasmid mobilization protein n=1 Tax=Holdemanella biformis TaxID=1735 RepID=UPI000FF17D27|nr:hypothetical protein [Holdemanella biformis]RGU73250.1 hypothetical protein DWW49_03035 [Holdemanella biformis]
MRKRTKQFVIRLNDDELNHLNKLVKASNLSRESYLRMCINGLVPKPSPSTELIETIGILRQIAEFLSDISKSVYTQNGIDESMYIQNFELLQNQINEIMILIREPTELKFTLTQ